MSKSSNRSLRIALGIAKVLFGAAIVAWLIYSNWEQLSKQDWSGVRWGFMVAGFVASLAAAVVTFLRWYLLVRAQGLPFRIRDSIRIGFIGYFWNLFIPGAVGGDLVKSVLLAKEQQRKTVAVATVLVDRIIGLFALILLGGITVFIFWPTLSENPKLRQLAFWTGGMVLVAALGLLVLFSKWIHQSRLMDAICRLPAIGGMVREAVSALSVYNERKPILAVSLLMSLVSHTGFALTLRFTQLAMPFDPPPVQIHFMLVPLGLIVGAIPITPGGLGLAEGAMEKLFGLAGHPGALAVMMMLGFRVIQVLIALLGMVYYLVSRRETAAALRSAALDEDSNPSELEPAAT